MGYQKAPLYCVTQILDYIMYLHNQELISSGAVNRIIESPVIENRIYAFYSLSMDICMYYLYILYLLLNALHTS